jgi:hypothetical protein
VFVTNPALERGDAEKSRQTRARDQETGERAGLFRPARARRSVPARLRLPPRRHSHVRP